MFLVVGGGCKGNSPKAGVTITFYSKDDRSGMFGHCHIFGPPTKVSVGSIQVICEPSWLPLAKTGDPT
jgi:hypothetical protein